MQTTIKAVTMARLIASTNIPASLVRATVKQFGGWESFTQAARDLQGGGIDGGFHGFIHTRDTHAFARRNRAVIQEMASQQASDLGTSVTEMVQGFGCFRHQHQKPTDAEIGVALYAGKDDGAGVLNALAWYAGEEVARAYTNLVERE